MDDPVLVRVLAALQSIDGLEALVLGGSRARGTAGPNSDYDIGLYYNGNSPLNINQLRASIRLLVDDPTNAEVTEIGGWGPWINGGGWLTVNGKKVDILYRDLQQVQSIISDCIVGQITMNYQPGHPHGFCSAIWMGEVALCIPLSDPNWEIAKLKKQTDPFPQKLKEALITRFHWEVGFSIENAKTAIGHREQNHIAGCIYRALSCICQVLYAVNDRYLINEKNALFETEGFSATINGSVQVAADIWQAVGGMNYSQALDLLKRMAISLDGIVLNS